MEVVMPKVLAWMEERSFYLSGRIIAAGSVPFAEVARSTGESEVRVIVAALFGGRDDVFNLERKVKDEFWGVAIFALVFGSIGNERISGIHEVRGDR